MIAQPGYFVELIWPSVTVRLSSRRDQAWDGQTWVGGRLGKVALSATGGAIEVINADLVYSALLLNEQKHSIPCRVWGFDDAAPEDAALLFDGVADCAEIGKRVTFSLEQENTLAMTAPRRRINLSTGFNHLTPAGTRLSWGGQTIVLEAAR